MAVAAKKSRDGLVGRLRAELPRLLKEHPDLKTEIAGLLADQLTTREETNRILEEIRLLREDTARQFGAMDRRFEAMDRRFEAMDCRFEALISEMNKRFETLISEMNRRFEAVDKRFEAMDKRFETLINEMHEGFAGMRSWIIALGGRWGYEAEEVFRKATKDIVEKEFGGKVTNWQYLEGRKRHEVDVVIGNGRTILMEMKSSFSRREFERFVEDCEAYERVTGTKADRKIVMTVFLYPDVSSLSSEAGVEIISK